MRVAVLVADSNGCYPVPASKDGAVSTLIESLIRTNSDAGKVDFTVVSYYDKEALALSEKYKNVDFIWIKTSFVTRLLDKIAFKGIKLLFRKKKALSFKSVFSLLSYIRQSSKILKKNHFDKVVLENNVPLAWTIKLSKYSGEFYYHFHNIPRLDAKCREVFEKCTAYLCVSGFVGSCITSDESAIGKIPEENIRVLYNCIDTRRFKKAVGLDTAVIKEKYGVSPDEKIVIFVGRLSAEKGILELLEAAKLMTYKNFRVMIVGSYLHNINEKDEYQQKLHNVACELGDKIIFTGYVNQTDLPVLYNISDVAVLPSMWDEPAGLTMVEAMACGVPVITTASGGIPEYMGDAAVVLRRDDRLIQNIALKTDEILYASDKQKEALIEKGAERVRENFNTDIYLDRFKEALK